MKMLAIAAAALLLVSIGTDRAQAFGKRDRTAPYVRTSAIGNQGTPVPVVTRLHPVIGSVQRTGHFANPITGRTKYTGLMYNPYQGNFSTLKYRQ